MATSTRICKVCNVEYPYCKTARPDGLYRWDNVACCPEHAAIYFAEVEAARSGKPVTVEEEPKGNSIQEEKEPEVEVVPEEEDYYLVDPDEDDDEEEDEELFIF